MNPLRAPFIAFYALILLVLAIFLVLIVLDNGRTILIPTGDGGIVPIPNNSPE